MMGFTFFWGKLNYFYNQTAVMNFRDRRKATPWRFNISLDTAGLVMDFTAHPISGCG